jgi:peptide/nickel transport system ATP-binding protein
LIITHDLGVVANVAEEVVVIYNGRLMESGTLEDIFERPAHPYLKALLHAVPRLEMARDERLVPIREIKLETGRLLEGGRERVHGREETPLIEIRDVSRRFTTRKDKRLLSIAPEAPITAVDNVSLEIKRGECLGLVGESGCGKTTLSKIMMCAIDASSGTVVYNDNGRATNLLSLSEKELFPLRRKFQYIFQDPFGSLNPRMTVFDIVSEPLIIHDVGDSAYRREMVTELMRLVGLDPRCLSRYPHSFSGGQRQRIGIARALALMPELLICDEPVSALDVSVQAQVLNLLKDLQTTLGLTYLFISHNMAVVNYMADRIAVMCAGNIVEMAPSEALFRNPIHPYTRALVAAVPTPDLGRTLDLSSLMGGRASDPTAWPPPFDAAPDDSGQALQMVDLGGGHFVFARAAPPIAEAAK